MIKPRKPNRLKVYDYSLPGYYFVTICTEDKGNMFGNIVNGKIVLNSLGLIIEYCIRSISKINKFIELDYYVIMPNHLHAIIIINVGDAKFAAPTMNIESDNRTKMLLSKIIQQFKRACTIGIKNKTEINSFKWQRSFYDRIIRNEKELYNIRKYIKENPLRWDIEKEIPENLDLL